MSSMRSALATFLSAGGAGVGAGVGVGVGAGAGAGAGAVSNVKSFIPPEIITLPPAVPFTLIP